MTDIAFPGGLRTMRADIRTRKWPQLNLTEITFSSPVDDLQNCLAYAVGDDRFWWWPPGYEKGNFWPLRLRAALDPADPELSLSATLSLLRDTGYEECRTSDTEKGYDKIAIYTREGLPEHFAKQTDGVWRSKVGELQDIEHALPNLEGGTYGMAKVFLRRPVGWQGPIG